MHALGKERPKKERRRIPSAMDGSAACASAPRQPQPQPQPPGRPSSSRNQPPRQRRRRRRRRNLASSGGEGAPCPPRRPAPRPLAALLLLGAALAAAAAPGGGPVAVGAFQPPQPRRQLPASASASARSPLFRGPALGAAAAPESLAGPGGGKEGGKAGDRSKGGDRDRDRIRGRGGAGGGDGGGEQSGAPPASPSEVYESLDSMRARAGVIRTSIVRQQLELQQIERRILCETRPPYLVAALADLLQEENPARPAIRQLGNAVSTLGSSFSVLRRKLIRVRAREGPKNQQWESVGKFVENQGKTGLRIVQGLVENPERIGHIVTDPATATLVPHVPAILARLDRLEPHVAGILEGVLNNKRHLASVEPYLSEILERFDDIEPHLPWILRHIDILAPYTGLLLKHIDELLIYAETDELEAANFASEGTKYDLADQLLPYLEYYVSHLDTIGPHLPLLRPHVPLLLKHGRIGKISPHISKLFARGYADLSASANMDVLLFWFGWTLRIPLVPALFFKLPWSSRIVSLLARRLPKRFCRRYCTDVGCSVDMDYGSGWNKLQKA